MAKNWKRALVTGASSGIGREIARQLAAAGTDLVVVARDTDRLNQLAAELSNVTVEVLTADLSTADGLASIEERVAADDQPIDLLVNNAGFGFSGSFPDLDIEKESAVVQVNVVAVHRLCHAAARAMKARGSGTILNISSMASYLVSAESATYTATKHFVTAFSESLHLDMKPHGVTVTAACPGFTRTEFQERAGVPIEGIPDALWQDAADCAAESLAAAAKGRAKVVTGTLNKGGAALAKGLPGAVLRKVMSMAPTGHES